jgi:hypothetical protein
MRTFTITDQANQKFTIPFEDIEIKVQVRFLTIPQIWVIDIEDTDGFSINGYKMSAGVRLLMQNNRPYDIYIVDNSNLGLDPFSANSFKEGLYTFLLLERADLVTIRGYDVE